MTSRHVLLVIPSLDGGGAERAMTELAAFLAERGWRVAIATFTRADERDFYVLPAAVRRLRLGNPAPEPSLRGKLAANRWRVRALRAAMLDEQPDVVLSFLETTNVLALLAARRLALPVVVAERIDPAVHPAVPAPWRLARRLLYRRAAAVVAQTQAAAQWLQQQCATAAVVIPNALRPLPAPSPGEREPLVLSVGRLEPQKGFDVLLEAFARARERFPDWRLAIIGEGPLRDALAAQAARLGISEAVQWPGRTREIEAWYARAAVVAQASRFEGYPNVVLEAMGMGAAVVSTDCRSGPRELITSGQDGLLVPVDDVPAMARALCTLMGDQALRQRLGQAAMAVRSRHAAPAVLGRWDNLLAGAARRDDFRRPATGTLS